MEGGRLPIVMFIFWLLLAYDWCVGKGKINFELHQCLYFKDLMETRQPPPSRNWIWIVLTWIDHFRGGLEAKLDCPIWTKVLQVDRF